MRFPCHRSSIIPGLLAAFLLSSCSSFFVTDHRGEVDNRPVKILILKSKGKVAISSRGTLRLYQDDRLIANDRGSSSSFDYDPAAVTGTLTVESGKEPIMVNGQTYRGSMIIRRQNDVALIINLLTIDEYLLSVVPGEIPANWEKEALKAQAVAARTFTYYHINSQHDRNAAYDLDATAATQVYRGMADEKPQTTEAVRETAGQVMVYEGKPIVSYFHSTCGGKTVDDRYVWKTSHLPYLQGTRCGFCNDSTKFKWESTLSLGEIRSSLSKKYPDIGQIRTIAFRKKDDRVVEVMICHSGGTIRISGNNFRLMFPPDRMRSLYFTSKKNANGLILTGQGWGHGVGLCQWGARGMAMRGYGYRDILGHYYMGIKIASAKNSYIASKHKNQFMYQ